MRKELRKIVNANAVEVVKKGFQAIDAGRDKARRRLERLGVAGTDDFLETFALEMKKLVVKGLSGK